MNMNLLRTDLDALPSFSPRDVMTRMAYPCLRVLYDVICICRWIVSELSTMVATTCVFRLHTLDVCYPRCKSSTGRDLGKDVSKRTRVFRRNLTSHVVSRLC
jgi:hypothetical protein